jgi:hypothetical protein
MFLQQRHYYDVWFGDQTWFLDRNDADVFGLLLQD